MAENLKKGRAAPPDNICMIFTDIVGSTNLVDTYGDTYTQILGRHNELIGNAIQTHRGEEIRKVGDSVLAVFPESGLGVKAAVEAQRALDKERWAHGEPLRVRMGLHRGSVQRFDGDLVGIEVHRAAPLRRLGMADRSSFPMWFARKSGRSAFASTSRSGTWVSIA